MSGPLFNQDNINDFVDQQLYSLINKHNHKSSKNILIMSGGGTKGLAHIGGLKALKELNILDDIKTIAGSSAGALVGFLFNIGYSPEELINFVMMFDMKKIQDLDPSGLLNSFGMDNGHKFSLTLSKMVEEKMTNPNITFRELYNKTGITLYITGTCMNNKQPYYFSYKTNPNMAVVCAVRIAISFPIYFTPVEYEGKMYIDGGCIDNYPIQLFKHNIDSVIGFYLSDARDYIKEIKNVEDFFVSLIECLFENVHNNSIKGFEQYTVKIKIPNIDSMDFNLSDSKKKDIISFGYIAVKQYFDKNRNFIK